MIINESNNPLLVKFMFLSTNDLIFGFIFIKIFLTFFI